jgi:6-pyruvoyltetrahydropterin/6-carboxytetrahydropterin synthase
MFELQFRRRFSMAHRLNRSGSPKCVVPHGHNEFVTVRLIATDTIKLDGDVNMVEPFENAKRTWHQWIDSHVDHAFQLSESDPLLEYFLDREPEIVDRIMVFPGDPTTELLAACFKSKLSAFLKLDGIGLKCLDISIEETPTNSVRFSGVPEDVLPECATADQWWMRPDMSINNLNMVGPLAVVATSRIGSQS